MPPGRSDTPVREFGCFDVREALREWAGADLTQIGGIGVSTALKVLVELGPDLSKFKSAEHFCSWLGLCPGVRISGGKLSRLVYAMLTGGAEYVEQSQAQYEEKFQARTLKHLQQKAKSLGFDLVPAAV